MWRGCFFIFVGLVLWGAFPIGFPIALGLGLLGLVVFQQLQKKPKKEEWPFYPPNPVSRTEAEKPQEAKQEFSKSEKPISKITESETVASKIDFVAIDFETANNSRWSACELGIAVVRAGQIVETKKWRVNPGQGIDWLHTGIHGISARDVADCPTWQAVWPEIKPFLAGRRLLAHNMDFDSAVLLAVMERHGLDRVDHTGLCSVKIARQVLTLSDYKLPTVCAALEIRLSAHHDAESDARAAAEAALKMLALAEVADLEARIQTAPPPRRATEKKHRRKPVLLSEQFEPSSLADESNPLFGKTVVVTGTFSLGEREEIWELLAEKGAIVRGSLSGKTDILFVGLDAGPSKLEKAELLPNIEILDEDDLEAMLAS